MQAAVFTGANRPLELETLEVDEPRAGEVRVRMLASGICHSDLHVVEGEWPEDPPIVLGHEGFGEVEAVGDAVAGVAAGDRVVLSWYAPCGMCDRCLEGRPWICQRSSSDDHLMSDGTARLRRSGGEAVRSYLGVGSFGERAVVAAAAAVPVPPELPAEVGALIGCGVTTGVGAVVNTARVEPGSSTCTTRSWTWRATSARPTPSAAARAPARTLRRSSPEARTTCSRRSVSSQRSSGASRSCPRAGR